MEWLDDALRGARQFLRAKGVIDSLPWQAVIELSPAVQADPKRHAYAMGLLKNWETTDAGQALFADLRDAQSRVPQGHVWKKAEGYTLENPADAPAFHRELGALFQVRQEPRKMLLYLAPLDQKEWSTYDRYVNGGHYADAHHLLALNPLKLGWETMYVPKLVEGKRVAGKEDPLSILAHETQHGVDALNLSFAQAKEIAKPRYHECHEVRAVGRERALQKELGLPERYAYFDPALELEATVKRGALATADGYEHLRNALIKGVAKDVIGCTREGFSTEPPKRLPDVEKVVDQALANHGIKKPDGLVR